MPIKHDPGAAVSALLKSALSASSYNEKYVPGVARVLCEAMATIHGGEWIAQISHEPAAEFVFVRLRVHDGGMS